MVFCVSKFQKNGRICGFHWTFRSKKCFSFRGASPPWPPDQGLCPWTPLGALPPDSRYRLALRALAMAPPLPNPKYATVHIRYSDAAISNATIKARIRQFGWVTGCRQELCIENCSYPLQIHILILTNYIVIALSDATYHHRPPTTNGLATIHVLRTDTRHIVPKTRPNGRPKIGHNECQVTWHSLCPILLKSKTERSECPIPPMIVMDRWWFYRLYHEHHHYHHHTAEMISISLFL